MTTIADVAKFLESFAPSSLAEAWDNVGLLVGDRAAESARIMTCLTVTPTTAQEAIGRHASLIVTHHPVLFRPVQRMTTDDTQGRMLWNLIRAGIAIYSPHTAFDGTLGGINEMFATRLGLHECRPIREATSAQKSKLVVFVPNSDLEAVSRALFDADAGIIGEYRECSFRVAGRGTFFGSDAANPTVGQAGRREEVDEWRLEVLLPTAAVSAAVAAMRRAHSYEEPAYDVYPLAALRSGVGAGRYGELKAPTTLEQFANQVRNAVQAPLVQVVGARDKTIRRVAIGCGAGSEFLSGASAAQCDVLVTGEAGLHRQLEAEATGIALVLCGHFSSERFGVEVLAGKLQLAFPHLEVWASETEKDPCWVG
jgi:dinuclear metal center YbgI/SA1388 family protein